MRILSAIIFLACAVPQMVFCADAPPAKMTHLSVQMSGSGIAPDSFAAKPKVMWRAANGYCRVDEEPDSEHGIHGRLIVNEPDAWMINLADNTARHFVDPGPTFNCKLPIFAFDPDTLKTKIGELEFGHELEFFLKNGASQVDGPKLSFAANYYELKIDDAVLRLVEIVDVHAPKMIGFSRGDKSYVVNYLLWDDQAPFKADIFAKPTGVRIEEQ
ncbi:MAG TPA: hypothetical protein VLT90_12680 [Terriglobales bacterium]|nr:hypothetical protein [Terriglobales bacterium]